MKKTYKVKNYKGNLVESLSRFQKSHKGMKIVEAVEKNNELRIKTDQSDSGKEVTKKEALIVKKALEKLETIIKPALLYLSDPYVDEQGVMYMNNGEFHDLLEAIGMIALQTGDYPNIDEETDDLLSFIGKYHKFSWD